MQKLHRFLLPLAAAATLVACSKSGTNNQQQAVSNLPPMSANCESLHDKFERSANATLCNDSTPGNVLEASPLVGGALLQSVERKQITVGNSQKGLFQYTLQFRTRDLSYIVYAVSEADVDFQTNKFYAVDLMNNCRYQAMKDAGASGTRYIKSFKLPSRLACL